MVVDVRLPKVFLLDVLVSVMAVCRGGVVVVVVVLAGQVSPLLTVAKVVGHVQVLVAVNHTIVLMDLSHLSTSQSGAASSRSIAWARFLFALG